MQRLSESLRSDMVASAVKGNPMAREILILCPVCGTSGGKFGLVIVGSLIPHVKMKGAEYKNITQ